MRKKLIELLETVPPLDAVIMGLRNGKQLISTSRVADHLIANGVTIQKWIPVTERLPKRNADGTVKCVLVTNGKLIHMAYLCEREIAFCDSGQMAEPMFYKVTHWMPLPEPPKGE